MIVLLEYFNLCLKLTLACKDILLEQWNLLYLDVKSIELAG